MTEVDPSDVRKQAGDFGKVFEETCMGKSDTKSKVYIDDVKCECGGCLSFILGTMKQTWLRNLWWISPMCLNVTPSRDFDDLVGIKSSYHKVESIIISRV